MKKKPVKKVKLNYPQRVVATPLNLSANEIDRAHTSTYFIIDTLSQYQENFLAREYRKFWYELNPKEAVKRIDEEMSKFGMNVATSSGSHNVIFNVHFAIYVYQNKKFLCPRMIVRDLIDQKQSVVDTGAVLIAPHCLARMLSRSGLEFKDAVQTLGKIIVQLFWSLGVDRMPHFHQNLQAVDEVGVPGVGNLRCEKLILEEPLYCDAEKMVDPGKSCLLVKTWINEKTLEDGYYEKRGAVLMDRGEIIQ